MVVKLRKRRSGFTLLEVVIALGITTILLKTVVFFMIQSNAFVDETNIIIEQSRIVCTLNREIKQDILRTYDRERYGCLNDLVIIDSNTIKIMGDKEIKYREHKGNIVREVEGGITEIVAVGWEIEHIEMENDTILKIDMLSSEKEEHQVVVSVNLGYWDYQRK